MKSARVDVMKYGYFVNNQWQKATDNKFFEVHEPYSGDLFARVAAGSRADARAVEQLRLVMASLQVATVRPQVGLSLFTDFENSTHFTPAAIQEKNLTGLLDHVISWSGALKTPRDKRGD